MEHTTFNMIVASIEAIGPGLKVVENLSQLYPDVGQDTLQNIYSNVVQKKVKKYYHRYSQPAAVEEYYGQYCNSVESGDSPGVILRMAHDMDFSPAMLAKIILEHHVLLEENQYGITSRSQVNKLLRDTTLIKDRDLSYEVQLCLLEDDVYGPYADSMKNSIGYQYEFHLRELLTEKGIPFQDEDVLRLKGYDKTPDIKLELPIAVEGHIVNWIESKALFGDEENHRQYLKDQFWSYWNRFGPGLVIYWFGYLKSLDNNSEKGILLRDDFPTDFIKMDPSALSS